MATDVENKDYSVIDACRRYNVDIIRCSSDEFEHFLEQCRCDSPLLNPDDIRMLRAWAHQKFSDDPDTLIGYEHLLLQRASRLFYGRDIKVNPYDLSNLFLELLDDNYIVVNQENVYVYMHGTKLWECYPLKQFDVIPWVVRFIIRRFRKVVDLYYRNSQLGCFFYKFYDADWVDNMWKYIQETLRDDTITFDDHFGKVHYQNGVYEKRTGLFRRRERIDYVTTCLPYTHTQPLGVIIPWSHPPKD